ncbi:MAG: biotin--[acetyl-CoA-carboxylase] ligase [Clostridiaceae bacterium]|nr:biotin--[acetyl-CoA-carboxylase] ligase [Clostridiaceae bacterium]
MIQESDIVHILSDHSGQFVSGESLANLLGCSRAAVWKKIRHLREKGYPIEAVTNKGYRYMDTHEAIEYRVNTILSGQGDAFFKVKYFDRVDSTNAVCRELGREGAQEGLVVGALVQQQGRGRRGNDWLSDHADGLWFSILVRPETNAENLGLLSLVMSLSVHDAFDAVGYTGSAIKWPNDIVSLQTGRKICGILSEASFEDQRLSFAVIGCGINVSQKAFPDSIESKATSLFLEGVTHVTKELLLIDILAAFKKRYDEFLRAPSEMLCDYRSLCVTLGREVRVEGALPIIGKAYDIDTLGRLIVRDANSQVHVLSAGDVSVRGIMGYTDVR